jgi:hypothetical protein
VAEWAIAHRKRSSGRCRTCAFPSVVPVIHEVLGLIASGEADVSISSLRRMLAQEFNYPYKDSALRTHIVECERAEWARCKKRRGR